MSVAISALKFIPMCYFLSDCRFNRFDFPPIFHRKEDTNLEQLWVRINFYLVQFSAIFLDLILVFASKPFMN